MRRALRALASLAEALGVGGVFLASLGGSVAAHLDSPIVHRVVVARLNEVLGSTFAGRIVIDRVGSVGTTGVSGVDAHVVDPDGTTVLRVTGVSAGIDTATLTRSVQGTGDIVVDIDALSVASADVDLDGDERGLRIARAFAPPAPSAPSSGGGRSVRLDIPHALLAHVTLHGRPPGAPLVDGEVDGAEAGVAVTPEAVSLGLRHAHVIARGLPPPAATTEGNLDAHLTLPTKGDAPPDLVVAWNGRSGQLVVKATASLEGDRVDADVDVARARPVEICTVWPACPFVEPADAHAEAHGDRRRLTVVARASVGTGTVVVSGPIALGDSIVAAFHVEATGIDAHAITPSAPTSDLRATADVTLTRAADGAMGAVFSLDEPGGTLSGARLPGASVTGQVQTDGKSSPHGEATLAVREPGAPARATLHLVPRGSSYRLAFEAGVDSPSLGAIPGVGSGVAGAARATARGTLDLDTQRIDTTVDASLTGLRAGGASLDEAQLVARASGPVSAPVIDLELHGRGLSAGPLRFDRLHAQMKGPPTHAPVLVTLHGHDADFRGSADLDVHGGVTLRDVARTMDHAGESAKAEASLVQVASGRVDVEDLRIEGLGSPLHAHARVTPGALAIHASTRGLDLARLGHLIGQPSIAGRATLDVDADLRRTSADGHVAVDLAQASFGGWKDASAHLEATLAGRKVSGSLKAAVADVGSVALATTSVEIGAGSPLQAETWRGAWGSVDVSGHVDLAKLAARLPPGALPSPSGSVELKGHVARDSATDSTPDVDLSAATSGLALGGTPLAWRLDGIAVTTHVTVDGRTGHTVVDAQLGDGAGSLLTLAASSDGVPYGWIFSSDAPLRGVLLAMPFQATVAVHSGEVATLPAFLGTRGMQGALQARVDWRGSVEQPSVDVQATLGGARPDPTFLSLPVDLSVKGHYDGARATVTATAVHKGEPVLDAGASLDVRAHDLLGDGPLPWTASAQAKLTGFPLQSIAALDNRQVRGKASGTVKLDDLHRDARASATLDLTEIQIGDVVCKDTTVQLTADGHGIDASTRITETDGYAEARAHLGSTWGAALVPAPDPAVPAQVYFAAKNFRVAALLPFVSGVFTELDGRLDATASVAVDPVARTMKPQGKLTLRDGVFEVSALGNELHDAKATVTLTPDGVVKLENASARGLTGRVEAAATARFQGFDLAGAHALLQVSKKEPIPLVADGVQVGVFDGQVDVTVTRTPAALDVDLQVPSMRLQLPLSATHDVQALGPMKDVAVGIDRHGEFTAVPLGGDVEVAPPKAGGTPMKIAVHLGNDVEVKRGADLDVRLEGGPTIEVGKRVTAQGQIRLSRGTLIVRGKTFTFENGTVTFVDDPTNPQIVLTAQLAVGDTTVFADFVGPLKTGKVTLRSEPMYRQDEILSLLLYGTIDQTGSGGAGAPQLGAASGAVGSEATAGVNRALGGVNQALDSIGLQGGISTKLDTSQTTPRPEVEVQIARDISLQIAWVLGVPPPGSNPDQHLFTLNWRFLRQWSLQTTVGDAGTSILDLVWQHRY